MGRQRFLISLVVSLAATPLAGCIGDPSTGPASASEMVASPANHVLAEAFEPDELVAPTFKRLGTVARGTIQFGGGEPSIWAHHDGTIYLAWPGCDRGIQPPLAGGGCGNGPVYRTDDQGSSWKRLNRPADGRLSADGPNANGDNDVAVDAAGSVYAANLGAGGIQVWRSDDRGDTWSFLSNVTPVRTGADRQWLAASQPGHLIVTYMQTTPSRAVAIRTTWDGGRTWSNLTTLGAPIGWLGTVQFDPSGRLAYIPFTQRQNATEPIEQQTGSLRFKIKVARTLDGGATWDVVDTGVEVWRSIQGGQWSGVLMAPALDVTGDGTVVYAWSEESKDPSGATALGTHLKFITSRDQGASWSTPVEISRRAQKIMPWVTGGAGDRFAVTYYASDQPGDSDYLGVWDAVATVVDGVAENAVRQVTTNIEEDVHLGGICSRGTGCTQGASDRALLDFFEADLLPDGRLVVTYPTDPIPEQKQVQIRVALQDGGTPLLVRRDA